MTPDASSRPDSGAVVGADANTAALQPDDDFAVALRGFGPVGVAAIVVIALTGNVLLPNMVALPVGAALTLLWTWRSRTPWRDIGYVAPRSWSVAVVLAVVLGIAFKLLMKALVMPLLGAEPVNAAYHFHAGNRALLPAAVWAMINAGFAEETVFRGFFFERLGRLLGSSAGAKAVIVVGTSALFGVAHLTTQGLAGAEQGAIVGLVFGSVYVRTRSVFPLMVAHAAFDLMALALIYFDVEPAVAHMILR